MTMFTRNTQPLRVLALAPHTDDAELGAGGTLAKLVQQGHTVHVAAFTDCGNTELRTECARGAAVLGASLAYIGFKFTLRHFPEQRQDILDTMIGLRNELRPDMVFTPCAQDVHQDHQVVREESMRAFKHCTLLGYELPWNTYSFNAGCYSILEEEHVGLKVRALVEYTSQKHRMYMQPDAVRAHCRMRGVAINQQYAEAFQPIRMIL